MGHRQTHKSLGSRGVVRPGLALSMIFALLAGCETKSFFDPSEMGRYKRQTLVVNILKNLDTGIEEPDERFVNATDVRPADLVAVPTDYVIGKADLIQVSITDLVAPGVETVKTMRVSESGFISLPLIGQVKVLGLTEAQAEQAIVQAYRDANLIQNAQVSVVTLEARGRTFSISGAVTQSGQYQVMETNFRLLDALLLARDVTSQVGIEYVYIYRRLEHDVTEVPGAEPQPTTPGTQTGPDLLTPRSVGPSGFPKLMSLDSPDVAATAPAAGMANQPATTEAPAGTTEGRIIVVDDKPMQIEGGLPVPPPAPPAIEEPAPEQPAATPAKGFEFELKEPSDIRIIRVPLENLQRGELKYNVVIRPQDFIYVPQPVIGEYYMGGHVARTGVYSLTARTITLKQAVIAAGMLDPVAIPSRTQIVRRISPNQEFFARVDLDKVFAGEQPDIILKPDDQIMVGTNALAPFMAAFRNGFRLTYGFGFLYDRNYFDRGY